VRESSGEQPRTSALVNASVQTAYSSPERGIDLAEWEIARKIATR
jgi:hypothetical protein